ncbi:MAG: preprotein translocase subunit SecD [Methanolobus sp.]|jgi:preprotein translocase subunit SecD|uniref:preprotein translocase subunit SecD n=1 Tax=Methanolobus sp. TaxID=1874737 RepID=UPI0024AAAF20|nr:preprotein translocase subunit SecD [Methanolobus sp.]MDI3485386.1 preprotein translocase subunit SecD [Methanolobus sp.]MDK2832076.1 preprotein translocase subunit SecD [Methanolobus sp.]MDK2938761.1 preprotein translocase subunit SecD [Methanolobus sp.]
MRDDENQSLFKDIRVIVFIIAILGSIIFIHPGYSSDEGFTTNLNYGLDLEGGSWLQLKLQGAVAQLDADEGLLVKEIVNINLAEDVNIASVNEEEDDITVTFTSASILTNNQMDQLGVGQTTISRSNNVTQVVLHSTKETLISTYLADTLKTEVIPTLISDGVEYEIRTAITQEELEALMEKVGGFIVTDINGDPVYKEGVTTETRDLTKEILSDKLNSIGLKDIPVKTVGEDYILIDFAGIDLATAKNIAEKPGKFEIRIVTQGNESKHVLYGDEIESVSIVGYHEDQGQWYVPFTLTDAGAQALQEIAIETGATQDPMSHNLVMYLDENEVYSAPLSYSAADKLEQAPIYSWQASTGADEESKTRAEELQIHLRAGALPVNVELMGSGHVDASLGQQFKTQAVIAGMIALLAVAFVIFRKYNKPAILIPMVSTSISEVIMILGFAAAIGWQLDLASIAGIIAAIGTGIDHLVIITDEVLYEGKLPPRKVYLSRITKAFGIIFAASATTIIAMSPLVIMGFGSLKGFAITTIVGVLIGILIARPVYGKVIHEVLAKGAEAEAE